MTKEKEILNIEKLKKVSVIIPCYNQENYVAEAIESALAQTYENIEIVCYNDGSSDNSSAVISEYAQKYDNILFIDCKENKGVVFARNTAIANCSGDYILPLDADDKIDPTYVEKAAKILDKQVNTGIVYCRGRYIGAKKGEWKLPAFDRNEILYSNCIPNCALFRKSDFENVGGYHDYMNGGYEDWDLWLSLLSRGLDVHRLDEILFSYRQSRNMTRSNLSCDVTSLLLNLVKHHQDLYFESSLFVINLFGTMRKKLYKYKFLLKIFFLFLILELICMTNCLLGGL